MSFLLKKSEDNLIASIFLKDQNLLAPAIHCSYYSCIQKIISIFISHYPKLYNSEYKIKQRDGLTHPEYIREFSNIIRKQFKDYEGAWYINNKLTELKQLRTDSDYHEIEILIDKVEAAFKITSEFHRIVKKNMSI